MEQADEAGENRRANVSVHLAMQDEVYRYSAPARQFVLCKRRGKSRRLEAVALRIAVRSVTMHFAVRRVLRDSLSMEVWENSEVRQAGRPVMPEHRTLCIGVGYPGIPVRPVWVVRVRALPCSEGSPENYRGITGERSCRWPETLSFGCRTAGHGGRSARTKPRC